MSDQAESNGVLVLIPAGTHLEFDRIPELGGQDKLLTKQILGIYVKPGTSVRIGKNDFLLAKSEADVPTEEFCPRDYVLPVETDVVLSFGLDYTLSKEVNVRFPSKMAITLPVNTILLQPDSESVVKYLVLKQSCSALIQTSTLTKKLRTSDKIFAAKDNGDIDVIDSSTMRCITTLKGHTGACRHLCLSPDGSILVSAGIDNKILTFDTITYKQIHETHLVRIQSLSFSPGGRSVCVVAGDLTYVLDVCSGSITSLPYDNADIAIYSVDGNYIITADKNAILVKDSKTHTRVNRFSLGQQTVWSLSCFADNIHLSVGSQNYHRKYNMLTGEMVSEDSVGSVNGISISCHPQSDQVACGVYWGSTGNFIALHNTKTDTNSKLPGPHIADHTAYNSVYSHEAFVKSVAFSSTGDEIVSGGADRKVMVWDTKKAAFSRMYAANDVVNCVCW